MLPRRMLRHTVTVFGPPVETIDGPQPGLPETVRAHVEHKHKLVRDQQGDEVVSPTGVWMNPRNLTPGQLLDAGTGPRRVLAVDRYEHERMSHVVAWLE